MYELYSEKVEICHHMTAEFFLQSISPNELTYLTYINIKFLHENIMRILMNSFQILRKDENKSKIEKSCKIIT